MLPVIDPPLFHLLNAGTDSPLWLIQAARAASSYLPALGSALLAGWLWSCGPCGRRAIAHTLLALLLAWVACKLIRWGFPQPRPAQYGMGVQWILHPANASLPSMHATGAFALAQAIHLGIARHRRWIAVCAWIAATLVALSRVVLGVHFPSDVVAGALLGCASAWVVWQLSWRLQPRTALVPTIS